MELNPLQQSSSLIPIIEKVASDAAEAIVTKRLQDAQYSVAATQDHHHLNTDTIGLGPESITAFEPLPATVGGVVNPTVLGNQSVGQDKTLVGYGNLSVSGNQLTKGIFTTAPIPVVYGHGVGSDSAFNGGTAPYGTVLFFENGAALSSLCVNTVNGWYQMPARTLATAERSFAIATSTNGTSAVSVFNTTPGTSLTITGVYLVSKDTTAGNITVENPAGTTVATIAKGTVAGVMVGAVSLANTSVLSSTNLIVKSSSAGNATVFITYTV